MTGEEMERAIEFVLQSQANFEAQFAKTNQQMERTEQRVSMLAETQTEFIQAMLQHVEAQREINASLRGKTSNLERLQEVTEQRMSELAQAQQQTQKDLSDLAKTVGALVKIIHRNGNPPER
jgi:predicted  nucleic acid-binding Zn-ribbon protein